MCSSGCSFNGVQQVRVGAKLEAANDESPFIHLLLLLLSFFLFFILLSSSSSCFSSLLHPLGRRPIRNQWESRSIGLQSAAFMFRQLMAWAFLSQSSGSLCEWGPELISALHPFQASPIHLRPNLEIKLARTRHRANSIWSANEGGGTSKH